MIRKIAVILMVFCFLYLFSFFVVAAAPFEFLKTDCGMSRESQMDQPNIVHTVYFPFFESMHRSDTIRDGFAKICSFMNKDFENFSMLYWTYELQYLDVHYM